jgi:hypothetical protein
MRAAAIVLVTVLFSWVGGSRAAPPSTPFSPFTPTDTVKCRIAGCDGPLLRQFEQYNDIPFKALEHDRQAKKWDKEFARKESAKLIEALSVPCELADAEQAGGGKVKADGHLIQVNVFEASCRSGTGYFLVSQPPLKSVAISCFTAEAARAADVAKGVAPDGFTCELPNQRDPRLMAASIVQNTGNSCAAKDYRWVGVSNQTGAEFSEVACQDGQGYVIEVPAAGPAEQLTVVGCQEAVKQGILCSLTAVTKPVTLQTLRAAIKDHPLNCEPTQIRYVGRETEGRRYVVELQCPQLPGGLVAFIPLGDNPKPFETKDCSTAAAQAAVQCTLTAKQ